MRIPTDLIAPDRVVIKGDPVVDTAARDRATQESPGWDNNAPVIPLAGIRQAAGVDEKQVGTISREISQDIAERTAQQALREAPGDGWSRPGIEAVVADTAESTNSATFEIPEDWSTCEIKGIKGTKAIYKACLAIRSRTGVHPGEQYNVIYVYSRHLDDPDNQIVEAIFEVKKAFPDAEINVKFSQN